MDNEPSWTLYRCFDSDDRLLYVGQTSDWPRRQREHASRGPWWAEVTRVEMRLGLDSQEALRAEREAILYERPLHNTQGKSAPPGAGTPPIPHAVHFVSITEAGLMLGIGRTTIYDYVKAGDLHLVHHGRRSVVAVVEVDRLAARLAAAAGVDLGLLAS